MYGLSDQKSTPVCCGELSTDRGASSTNFVPRSRSSSTGRADGRHGGTAVSSCSCSDRFARFDFQSRTAIPPYGLTGHSPASRPPALHAHQAPRLASETGAAIGAGGRLGGGTGEGRRVGQLQRRLHGRSAAFRYLFGSSVQYDGAASYRQESRLVTVNRWEASG